MPWLNPTGLPGMKSTFDSQPRDIFYNGREMAQWFSPPPAVDGTLSWNPSNTPYTWLLFAGQEIGKVTATNKFATSIFGSTTVAYTNGGTSLTTTAAVATYLANRVGTSGTFKLTGPPTSGGTVATATVTYSAVNQTTGVITITTAGANYISGSFIRPTDGSEAMVSVIGDVDGLKVIDQLNTTRCDAMSSRIYAGGGIINVGYLVNYPADSALITWYKGQLRTFVPNIVFSDDLTG